MPSVQEDGHLGSMGGGGCGCSCGSGGDGGGAGDETAGTREVVAAANSAAARGPQALLEYATAELARLVE